MSKTTIKFMASYAREEETLGHDLQNRMLTHASMSRNYEFKQLIDRSILIGENWYDQIQTSIEEADFGLLLLSPSFFASPFIRNHELNHFIKKGNGTSQVLKPIVPVGLVKFDLAGDLCGLGDFQFFLHQKSYKRPHKFYNEMKTSSDKNEFAMCLLEQITYKLDRLNLHHA